MVEFKPGHLPTSTGHLAVPAEPKRARHPAAQAEAQHLAPPRAMGNQAMQHLLSSRLIQAKLTVSQPGDQYDQQDDRVADALMLMTDSETGKIEVPGGKTQVERIQRVCSGCE